jgi:CRISPR-associated protein Cas2
MDNARRSNREFLDDHAFGERLVFDRLKVKVDCLTDMPPGFFQIIPFGNATRKRRDVRGITAFIGWFVHDFESHARSRFNGSTGQIAVKFSLSSKALAILQLCQKLIERDLGLLQSVTERRTFHRHVRWPVAVRSAASKQPITDMETYCVAYDISDPKRLRIVARTCEEFGARRQFSVFFCRLMALGLVRLKARLYDVMDLDQDRVLFIPLCRRWSESIETLGRLAEPPEARDVVIVT